MASVLDNIITINRGESHNFSIGCLSTYFRLNENIKKNCYFFNGRILTLSIHGIKTFVFQYCDSDIKYLHDIQKQGPVYCETKIPLINQSSFTEKIYNLKDVFSASSYKNAKERYNKITYPFTWFKKNKVEITTITNQNFNEIEKLHNLWVEKKLNDPKTYKIMFPQKRYLSCCEKFLTDKNKNFNLLNIDKTTKFLKSFVLKINNEIVGVRVISIENNIGYDLAFFVNFWNNHSQIANYFNIFILKILFDQGIILFNCGASLNKNLSQFKSHYPNFEKEIYRYGKINI